MPSKLYRTDEDVLDVAGQGFLDQTLLIRMAYYMALVLGLNH